MAISTEDALKMVEADMAAETSQTSNPKEVETASAQTTAADGKTSDVVNANPEDKAGSEPPKDEGKESVGKSDGDPKKPTDKKQKRTNQQRLDYSFKKMKEELSAKDKRIAELEARLAKTSDLTEDDFAGDKKGYQEHLVNQALDKRELEEAKKMKESMGNELAYGEFTSALHDKADKVYEGKEEERDRFSRLMQNGFDRFAECVNSHDKNGVVFEFLDDNENAPMVLTRLMTDPTTLKRVLDHRSPLAMMRELQILENNIVIRSRISAAKSKVEAKPLPNLGSMVKTETNGETDVFDDAWGANYLKNHKRGRF